MKVDDSLGFNRPDALLGDAYRSLFRTWPFDVTEITCPVYIYSGEGDKVPKSQSQGQGQN